MDPLSITAGIISVIAATAQVSKGLRSLYELRHAPQEVLTLANEVSELQALLYLVQKAIGDGSQSGIPLEDQVIFEKILESARKPLKGLNVVIAACVRDADPGTVGNGPRLNISFLVWFKSRKSVGKLKKQLIAAHSNISTALTVLSNIRGRADNQLIMRIHDMVLRQIKENEPPMITKGGRIDSPQLGGTLTYVSDHGSSASRKNIQSPSSPSPEPEEPISLAGDKGGVELTHDSMNQRSIAEFVSIQVSVTGESCDRTCRCQCHRRMNLESSRWLTDALGVLFFRSIGSPLPMFGSCNATECIQQQGSSYQVTYHFPRWMTNRAFMLTATYRGLYGLSGSWSIGLPRAISASHKAWQYIQRHESTQFYKLLRERSIFGNDMGDDDGTSLLTYALKFRSHDIVSLLLKYGANLDFVDPRGISARAYAQSALLIDRPVQQPSWSAHVEFDNDGSGADVNLRFTPLHYVVTGLEKADLHQQLRLNRVHVNSPDCFGRSLVHWAVIMGNSDAVEALIAHGASPTCSNKEQMTPLHNVGLAPSSSHVQCGRHLLRSGADINALDAWKRTPLRLAAGFARINPEFIEMLIQNGADVNRRDMYSQSPLLKSIQGRKEATQLLLNHGADAEAQDIYGNTPVLEAIYRNKPKRLRMLLEHGVNVDEPFELKPGRRARSGPTYLLDFTAWYGETGVMSVIEEMIDRNPRLFLGRDNIENSRDFRLSNGRKAGEEEREAFDRIFSAVALRGAKATESNRQVKVMVYKAAKLASTISGITLDVVNALLQQQQ
ncbi:ankyrin repeat-containing domain protein [Nemania sp. NC0429]|nr:ankyrin repeat-containing domain protein [Nemania sp. NC0429]